MSRSQNNAMMSLQLADSKKRTREILKAASNATKDSKLRFQEIDPKLAAMIAAVNLEKAPIIAMRDWKLVQKAKKERELAQLKRAHAAARVRAEQAAKEQS